MSIKNLTSLNSVPSGALGGSSNGTINADGAELRSLSSKTGPITRLKNYLAASTAAGEAVKGLHLEQVAAESRIAFTSLRLAETRVRTALVAVAMPQIGALTVQLNAATSAVDLALTNTSMAATLSVLHARTQSRAAIDALTRAGNLSPEEHETLNQLSDADATRDIASARARVADAKTAVEGLHAFAQQTVSAAKEGLQ